MSFLSAFCIHPFKHFCSSFLIFETLKRRAFMEITKAKANTNTALAIFFLISPFGCSYAIIKSRSAVFRFCKHCRIHSSCRLLFSSSSPVPVAVESIRLSGKRVFVIKFALEILTPNIFCHAMTICARRIIHAHFARIEISISSVESFVGTLFRMATFSYLEKHHQSVVAILITLAMQAEPGRQLVISFSS